jgi:predicted O-methyltransferase YrrM
LIGAHRRLVSAYRGVLEHLGSARRSPRAVPEADEEEIRKWFGDKEFAYDWTSMHFESWMPVLAPLRQGPVRVLEIGSFEGRSALFFLNFLPLSTIVCVDAWDSSNMDPEVLATIPDLSDEFPKAQERFDRNLAPFAGRTTKIVGQSADILPRLALGNEAFDLIYVDGDHTSVAVYRDCTLSWPLLKPRGVMIFDDYEWTRPSAAERRPKLGVDAFLGAVQEGYRELHRGYQLIIQRKPR